MSKPLAPETIAAQAGGSVDAATGAIIPPIHLATTYLRDPDNQYRKGLVYSRPDNPLTTQVEAVLCQLEGGARALVLGSGMAAATAAFLALERPAHVVAPEVMYWGLKKWLAEDAPGLGIRTTFVDATSLDAIRAAVEPFHQLLVAAKRGIVQRHAAIACIGIDIRTVFDQPFNKLKIAALSGRMQDRFLIAIGRRKVRAARQHRIDQRLVAGLRGIQ